MGGVSPIQWQEIEAWRRITLSAFGAWEVRLLHRLDQAVLPILNPAPTTNVVSARDGRGVLSMIRGQAARHKNPGGDAAA